MSRHAEWDSQQMLMARDILVRKQVEEQLSTRSAVASGLGLRAIEFDTVTGADNGGSLTNTNGRTINGTGYAVHFLKEGSHPGYRLTLEFDAGERFERVAPGDTVRGNFSAVKVFRFETNVQGLGISGFAPIRLVIAKTPDARFEESDERSHCGLYTKAVTSGTTGHEPTHSTDGTDGHTPNEGVNIYGARGFRVSMYTVDNSNITAGSVRIWIFHPVYLRWFLTPLEYAVKTGVPTQTFGDELLGVKAGWLYAEPVGLTSAGGGFISTIVEAY